MKRPADTHYEARLRLSNAKRAMDSAQANLDEATDEWTAALRELDRLDGIAYPTAAEVRGILKD